MENQISNVWNIKYHWYITYTYPELVIGTVSNSKKEILLPQTPPPSPFLSRRAILSITRLRTPWYHQMKMNGLRKHRGTEIFPVEILGSWKRGAMILSSRNCVLWLFFWGEWRGYNVGLNSWSIFNWDTFGLIWFILGFQGAKSSTIWMPCGWLGLCFYAILEINLCSAYRCIQDSSNQMASEKPDSSSAPFGQ